MRIVAWNIRAGGGRRVEPIRAQIVDWNPDLVVLSEFRATPSSAWLADALRMDGWRFQRSTARVDDAARNSLLVASRGPVRRAGLRDPTPDDDRWLSLRAQGPAASNPSAGLSSGWGPLSIGAMHVPNRVSGRKGDFLDAALSVARRWRPGPALLVGDTNSGRRGIDEESPAFDRREERWIDDLARAGWVDAFRALHGDRREYTWYSPNGGNGFRLDYGFCNPALLRRLRAARHVWGSDGGTRRDALSDHAALLLDFD
jgi:exonuclease III